MLCVGRGLQISVPKPVIGTEVDLQKEPMKASSQFWAGLGGVTTLYLWRLDPGKILVSVMTDDLAWS